MFNNSTISVIESPNQRWATPWEVFNPLNEIFKFSVDAAANEENHKLPRYWAKKTDGLKQSWQGEKVWCNPPFLRGLVDWTWKAKEADLALIVLLANSIVSKTFCKNPPDYLILPSKRINFIPPVGVVNKRNTSGTVFLLYTRAELTTEIEAVKKLGCSVLKTL